MTKRKMIPFMLRLPPEIHKSVSCEAKGAGLSMNEYIVRRLGGSAEDDPDFLLELVRRIERLEAIVFEGLP